MLRTLLIAALLCAGSSASAATLTIGVQQNYNIFPFSPRSSATRYQQVWDASSFAGLGRIEITGVSFELASFARNAPTATYDLSFSATSAAVNGLDTSKTATGFDSNLGADNSLFNTTVFNGGAITGPLSFGGSFIYDPTAGNLLLDMAISDITGSGFAAIAATSNSGGLFSRSHDFGSGFANYGAIATFEYNEISEVPLPASVLLLGLGMAALGFAGRKRG